MVSPPAANAQLRRLTPTIVIPAARLNTAGSPQHTANTRAAKPLTAPAGLSPLTGEDRLELVDGRGRLHTDGRPVDPAGQSGRSVGVGERVGSIHENGGRTPKAEGFRLLDRRHRLVDDGIRVGPHADEGCFEVGLGDPPVGAVVEVEEAHVGRIRLNHDHMVDLPYGGRSRGSWCDAHR